MYISYIDIYISYIHVQLIGKQNMLTWIQHNRFLGHGSWLCILNVPVWRQYVSCFWQSFFMSLYLSCYVLHDPRIRHIVLIKSLKRAKRATGATTKLSSRVPERFCSVRHTKARRKHKFALWSRPGSARLGSPRLGAGSASPDGESLCDGHPRKKMFMYLATRDRESSLQRPPQTKNSHVFATSSMEFQSRVLLYKHIYKYIYIYVYTKKTFVKKENKTRREYVCDQTILCNSLETVLTS